MLMRNMETLVLHLSISVLNMAGVGMQRNAAFNVSETGKMKTVKLKQFHFSRHACFIPFYCAMSSYFEHNNVSCVNDLLDS